MKYKEPEILVDFEEDPFDETINDIEMKDDPPKKIIKPKVQRTKRQPSIIDQLTSYDIADDILNSPANVKIGQMLQYPDQKRNLTKILKRSATLQIMLKLVKRSELPQLNAMYALKGIQLPQSWILVPQLVLLLKN